MKKRNKWNHPYLKQVGKVNKFEDEGQMDIFRTAATTTAHQGTVTPISQSAKGKGNAVFDTVSNSIATGVNALDAALRRGSHYYNDNKTLSQRIGILANGGPVNRYKLGGDVYAAAAGDAMQLAGNAINQAQLDVSNDEINQAIGQTQNTGTTAGSNDELEQQMATQGEMKHISMRDLRHNSLGQDILNGISAGNTGATAGMSVGGPWGAVIGGVLGTGSSILGSVFGMKKAYRQKHRVNAAIDLGNARNSITAATSADQIQKNTVNNYLRNEYINSAAEGGSLLSSRYGLDDLLLASLYNNKIAPQYRNYAYYNRLPVIDLPYMINPYAYGGNINRYDDGGNENKKGKIPDSIPEKNQQDNNSQTIDPFLDKYYERINKRRERGKLLKSGDILGFLSNLWDDGKKIIQKSVENDLNTIYDAKQKENNDFNYWYTKHMINLYDRQVLPPDPKIILEYQIRDYLKKEGVKNFDVNDYGNGGKIHINPKNKGKFTKAAKKAGMGVQEYANHILANKDDYSSTLIKRANFARNAAKWHDDGGDLWFDYDYDNVREHYGHMKGMNDTARNNLDQIVNYLDNNTDLKVPQKKALLQTMFRESTFNPSATNKDTGARGLLQWLPSRGGKDWKNDINYQLDYLFDSWNNAKDAFLSAYVPDHNIKGSAATRDLFLNAEDPRLAMLILAGAHQRNGVNAATAKANALAMAETGNWSSKFNSNDYNHYYDTHKNEYYHNYLEEVAKNRAALQAHPYISPQETDIDEELLYLLNDPTYNYEEYLRNTPEEELNYGQNHWPDDYKTVYHPTFSDESVYSGRRSQYNPYGEVGGHWEYPYYGEVLTPSLMWNNEEAQYAAGGELNTQGGNFSNGLLQINEGGSHEENPLEGVPMGADREGTPNVVEEGETIYDDYVFSKRLEVPEDFAKKYKLGKNVTFAEASKKLAKESEERPNDPISKRGLRVVMEELKQLQDQTKEEKHAKEVQEMYEKLQASGISPEELAQQGVMEQQAADQQAMEQQAAEQQMMDQQMQEQMAQEQMAQEAQENPNYAAFGGKVNRFDENSNLELPTGTRKAGIYGNAAMVASDLLGLTNKPEYKEVNAIANAASKGYQPVKFNPIGNYITYKPFDSNRILNKSLADRAAGRRAVLNNAGQSRGLALAGLTAADSAYTKSVNEMFNAMNQLNQVNKLEAAKYNQQTNQFNSQGLYNAAEANQKAYEAMANRYLQGIGMAMTQRYKERQDTDAAKGQNLTNLIASLQNYGTENFNFNQFLEQLKNGTFYATKGVQ